MKKAGFNTIYCVHRDWRVALCTKHGIRMMVDVLAWHDDAKTDIRRNEEQRAAVRAICEKCRGDDTIWGYNIWNETMSHFGYPDKRSIDDYILMLKEWDPTHPVWMGTYRVNYANAPKSKPGVHGYYDYHWQRGFHWHFADLQWYRNYVPHRLPAFPEDFWMQVEAGEAVIGFFEYPGGGDAVYVANHNAFAPQKVVLKLAGPTVGNASVELFDRETGEWRRLESRRGNVTFDLRTAGGDLLRVEGREK